MPKKISSRTLITKHLSSKDRVLLINPPVEETRYSWIRWNQPLDLLKLGGYLKSEVGCTVELLDLMKPDPKGEVLTEWLPQARRYREVGDERYPMRRYGLPYSTISKWAADRQSKRIKLPTQVWITSLCSYWVDSVAQLCREVRQSLPDATIVLIGQLPRLMPELAADACAADFLVTKYESLRDQTGDISLYGDVPPPFLAIQLDPKTAIAEIRKAVDAKVVNFTFFEEDITAEGGEPLEQIVVEARTFHRHLRFHTICGLNPALLTPRIAKLLADPKLFAAVHFEQADIGGHLDIDAYQRAKAMMAEAGAKNPDARQSGFVWIGRPHDSLEELITNSFRVLNLLGGIILKPYTPEPKLLQSSEYGKYFADSPHQDWSPHFFPFAKLNGITQKEYHDLYRLAAFLNERIRSSAFDFLAGTLGAQFLRESLRKEVWKLEPSPLRIINQPAAV